MTHTHARAILACVTTLALPALASASCTGPRPRGTPPAPASAPPAPVEHVLDFDAAGLRISRYRLGNGLSVVLAPDPAARAISYTTWFRVGSADEDGEAGETGLAHLFEHLMFSQTRTLPEGEFDRRMEGIGAEVNAMTAHDFTAYVNALPPGHLDVAIELEADRMQSLTLTREQVETEREVVAEERLQSVEDSVEATLEELLFARAFRAHPYRWPIIGWMQDIRATTREKALAFYRRHYAPDRATVIVAGAFDAEVALAGIARAYGPLPAGKWPPPGPRPREAAPVESARIEIVRPVPADYLLVGFPAPAFGDPDRAAFELADEILTGGAAARLQRALVSEGELASSVTGHPSETRDPGLYTLGVQLRRGRVAREAEAVIAQALRQLAERGPEAGELAGARNRLRARFFTGQLSQQDRAELLGTFELLAGDFRALFRRGEEYERVTAEEVTRVVRAYLVDRPTVVAIARPAAANAVAAPAPPPAVRPAPAAPPTPAVAPAPAHDPVPEVDGVQPVTLVPGPAGSQVVIETMPGTPLVHVVVATRSGSARDPRGRDGLSHFAATVARRGAGGLGRSQLDAALDALGATLEVSTGPDSVRLTGHVLREQLEPFLALLADVLLRPDFTAEEVERTRRELLADLDELSNDDRGLAERFFAQRLYGAHGYGRAATGTRQSLPRLPREELARHFRAQFAGANLVFGLAGPLGPAQARDALGRHFAALSRGRRQAPPASPPVAPKGWRIQLVEKPERRQAQVLFGQLGLPANHPDRDALTVALTAFGGGAMNATLMQEVRVRRGLAYGAYLSHGLRAGPAPIRGWLATGEEHLVEALRLVLRLYEDHQATGLDDEQLAFWKQYLIGTQASQLDDPRARLSTRVEAIVLGLPLEHPDGFAARIARVGREDVLRALTAHVHPRDLAITVLASPGSAHEALIASGIPSGAIDRIAHDAR